MNVYSYISIYVAIPLSFCAIIIIYDIYDCVKKNKDFEFSIRDLFFVSVLVALWPAALIIYVWQLVEKFDIDAFAEFKLFTIKAKKKQDKPIHQQSSIEEDNIL